MTKLENNIKNLCVENMGIYGCKHAVKEHVWTGKAHMIAKLKKNVKSISGPFADEDILFACEKMLHKSKYFEKYRFSNEAKKIYIDSHYRSVKNAELL